MDQEKDQKKKEPLKIVVIVLAILLGISLIGLAATLIYNKLVSPKQETVTVPDNIITEDPEDINGEDDTEGGTGDSTEDDTQGSTGNNAGDSTQGSDGSSSAGSGLTDEQRIAAALRLYRRQETDNEPFQVTNMFPGDVETKYYNVQVTYKSTVTVCFHADIRPGYEKLAEVLKCRIVLKTTGETLYDGLMRDMPEALEHKLSTAADRQTDELYYEITAYLETSVGNEYMEKDLIADFRWWVPETENLVAPKTGDTTNIAIWVGLAAGALVLLLILLVVKRRKEDKDHE